MASQAVVLCGNLVIEWSLLLNVLIWNQLVVAPANYISGLTAYDVIYRNPRRDSPQSKSIYYLADAVDVYGRHLCAHPRDKIYGLLGLVDCVEGPPIEADYSLSIEEVYQVFCAHLDGEDYSE